MNNQANNLRFNFLLFAIAGIVITILNYNATSTSKVAQLSYDAFQRHLQEGLIAEVVIDDQQIKGTFREPQSGKQHFVTTRVEPDLAKDLAQYQVRFSHVHESAALKTFVSWVMPLAMFLIFWIVLSRFLAARGGMSGGFMSVGKSKAKVYVEKDTKTTFDDVAGADEAKSELKEIVEFLTEPKAYGRLGARIPKGVLLVGPPGTGKTLLARAVAGEARVPFFTISGSEFVEMFVGVGAARVKDLFVQARSQSPCIIFIDELDALGRARSSGPTAGGHDEKEQTLNQLLVELDGFDVSSGVVVLAATNRPEVLDSALLRSGRFDRQVLVDRPDRKGRLDILKVHIKKVKLAGSVDLGQIAALTVGFTGADLANLVNEAALVATRRKAEAVDLADFTAAIERIIAGLEKRNRLLNPLEREFVAHHEMGHVLVAHALPGADRVHKVSIIPRGIGSLGYTIQRPTEDRYLMTRQELENRMAVLLGGRAAEHLMFNHLSTGASDDIAKATEIARAMVTKYGMEESLGHAAYEPEGATFMGGSSQAYPKLRSYSDKTARDIDSAIKSLIDRALNSATHILKANHALLADSAQLLLTKESLDEEELRPILAQLHTSAAPPARAVSSSAGLTNKNAG